MAQNTDISDCIHCHKCRDNCDFLTKYNIDIGDEEQLREHAYSCFMCGRCTAVCPISIDGRAEVMRLRRERACTGERKEIEKAHAGLLREKRNYIYRNYRHAASGSVFFPGCNFPSLYPKTSERVSRMLEEAAGIQTVYDCCGKPVAELGLESDEEKIISGLRENISKYGISELVTACPNCMDFLKNRLEIPVVSIYAKLSELGIGNTIHGDRTVFLPCPDRYDREWVEEIKKFVDGEIRCIDSVQCCGLGGSAAGAEPEIARGFIDKIDEQKDGIIYSYCASCTGSIRRGGVRDVRHILSEIVAVDEKPDVMKSYFNRMLTKRK